MTQEYERTSLWGASLRDARDGLDNHRQRLRTEYSSFRSRVGKLVERIQQDFPSLTVHDLSHIDELWRIASLIAGPDYSINPLEAFVLGGAFLLHDSALCFEAYRGGRDAVHATDQWQDAFAAESRKSPSNPESERKDAADFVAVRSLHASQARDLAAISWKQPGTEDPVYLINDSHIRMHLGERIGQIAASHHWNIEEVSSTFKTAFSAPGEFPAEWQFDCVKIACLLRCADALHIDNKRAPDFLHALIRRKGISFQHWQAQNWLGRPSLDPADSRGTTVLVTSTKAFPKEQADSWWVAFDALAVADKEIKAANSLLDRRAHLQSPSFKVRGIKGCEGPEALAEVVQTIGWQPCAASLHVDNIESLVSTLGGKLLYGDSNPLGIAIRELIQNARDAVCARRAMEPSYKGEILISYDPTSGVIDVEDDGIGMSQRVLTGPLLAFGTSFWASELIRSEFPGLMASPFRSSGRFGIGFYSVFMAADSVTVTSRRFDEAQTSTTQIEFPRGLTLRPTLSVGRVTGFHRSTRVTVKLKPELLLSYQDLRGGNGIEITKEFAVTLDQYLASMVAPLDVCVSLQVAGQARKQIHDALPISSDLYDRWLRQLSLADSRNDTEVDMYITTHAKRLRPIACDGRLTGLAAIATIWRETPAGGWNLGRLTAGLLTANICDGAGRTLIGFIETGPDSAKRNAAQLQCDSPIFKEWANEQLTLLMDWPLSGQERFFTGAALAQFGIDSRPLARIPVYLDKTRLEFLSFEQTAELLRQRPIAIYKSRFGNFAENYHRFTEFPGCVLIRPLGNVWHMIDFTDEGIPTQNFSLIDLLHRTAVEMGLKVSWETRTNVRSMDVLGHVDVLIATAVN